MNKNMYFTEKKEHKDKGYFYSQLPKQTSQNKSNKKYISNKEKKTEEDVKSISHCTINQNKISNRYIFTKEIHSKTIKKIAPNNIFPRLKTKKRKENSEKRTPKKMYNASSISSLIKKNLNSEFNNNLYNNDNNSNIHIGSNNKITIIKNIFNRINKPMNKERNKKIKDIKMKIIKTRKDSKNNFTILNSSKKIKNNNMTHGIRNKIRKKIINRQSLSTYSSIDNIGNENNFLGTSNNKEYYKDGYKDVYHCYTIANNLKLLLNVNNHIKDGLNFSFLQ